jgi:hypothetical protein
LTRSRGANIALAVNAIRAILAGMKWSSSKRFGARLRPFAFAVFGLVGVAFLALGPLAACTESATNGKNEPDGGLCCPIQYGSCSCVCVGGTRSPSGFCRKICDVPSGGFVTRTDENGCPVRTSGSSSGGGCGRTQPPVDASEPEDAADAADTAGASTD